MNRRTNGSLINNLIAACIQLLHRLLPQTILFFPRKQRSRVSVDGENGKRGSDGEKTAIKRRWREERRGVGGRRERDNFDVALMYNNRMNCSTFSFIRRLWNVTYRIQVRYRDIRGSIKGNECREEFFDTSRNARELNYFHLLIVKTARSFSRRSIFPLVDERIHLSNRIRYSENSR